MAPSFGIKGRYVSIERKSRNGTTSLTVKPELALGVPSDCVAGVFCHLVAVPGAWCRKSTGQGGRIVSDKPSEFSRSSDGGVAVIATG